MKSALLFLAGMILGFCLLALFSLVPPEPTADTPTPAPTLSSIVLLPVSPNNRIPKTCRAIVQYLDLETPDRCVIWSYQK
jgi:hypothetical protein